MSILEVKAPNCQYLLRINTKSVQAIKQTQHSELKGKVVEHARIDGL